MRDIVAPDVVFVAREQRRIIRLKPPHSAGRTM
jgi:hypothetical protein